MGIKIGSDPAGYYDTVGGLLTKISENRVGNVLINRVLQHKKSVRIYPMDKGKAARIGDDNASTDALNHRDGAPAGASRAPTDPTKPFWFTGHPDHPATREDEREVLAPRGMVGTGKGSDAVTYINPASIVAKKVYDRSPEAVLFHEMVHALRIFHGVRNPIPTSDYKWMNEEEWLAVLLTNVYMSAGGSTRLRGGYGDYDQRLAPPEDTSSGFLTTDNVKILDNIWKFWGPVMTDFGFVIVAPFNPVREYMKPRLPT